MTVFSAALLIFLVLDPFGNIPFFLAALHGVEPSRQKKIITRELLIALVALLLFLLTGQYVLRFLGISEPSLTVAEGIILFLIAIRMIFPGSKNSQEEGLEGEPFIVPHRGAQPRQDRGEKPRRPATWLPVHDEHDGGQGRGTGHVVPREWSEQVPRKAGPHRH